MFAWGGKRTGLASAVVAALLILASFVAATSAQGRVGGLDPAFGEAGRVGPWLDRKGVWSGMAVGPDGSIVVIRERTLIRFLSSGDPDPSFGGGQVELPVEFEGFDFRPFDLAIDSKGRVLVSGTATDSSRTYGIPGGTLFYFPASWAVVVRLTADGKLDPGFGEGRGFIRGDYGMHPGSTHVHDYPPDPDFPAAGGETLKVDSLDRPVLLVATPASYSPCWGHSGVSWYPRAVVRLTTAGTVDAGFGGGDGIASLGRLAPSPGTVLALDAADQIAVGGGEGTACPRRGILFRLAADGSRLAGFGVDGVRTYARRYFRVLAPTGAMILRGIEQPVALRVGRDGTRDRSFGKGGEVTMSLPRGERGIVGPVAVDARGRTLVAASFQLQKTFTESDGKVRRKRRGFLAVSRLLPNGKIDRAFGKQGWIVTLIGPHYGVDLSQAALDPQGRLVVLGDVGTWHRGDGFVITRYSLKR
jgi:uncharacterized delta-60 repeat protein